MSQPVGRKHKLFFAAVLTTYLFLGLIAFGPSLSGIDHRVLSSGDAVGDATLFIWFLGWSPHALVHGLNPFFSNAMFAPAGVNLAQNTEGPLLGWVLAPITLTWGPIVAANVLLLLAMPVSASAAFIVLRRWRIWGPAAALGGLVYGFSAYMIGQATGHPVLLFVPIPPFIVWTLVSILQRRYTDRRLGIQLGFLLAAQYLISPEVFTSLCVVVGIGMVLVAARNPARAMRVAQTVAPPIGIALAVSVLILAYPVWMLLAGPQHVSGATYPLVNRYHNDLFSFIVPGSLQRVSLGTQAISGGYVPGTWHLYGLRIITPTEFGGYVGIPLLIVIGLLVWRSRRSARMQLSAALLVSCAILSLGPFLDVKGVTTHIPLPFWILGHLPLADNLLPVRLSFEMEACLGAIIAFGLDDLRRRNTRWALKRSPRSRAVGVVLLTGVVLAVLVVTQLPRWPYESTQAVALPASLTRAIPGGDPLALTYPYAFGSGVTLPLLWQARAGFSFRLLGGYAFHPDQKGDGSVIPNPLSPNGLQVFLSAKETVFPPLPVTSDLVVIARTTVSEYHIRVIIVDRGYQEAMDVMDLFRLAFGQPTVSEGQFSQWIFSGGARATRVMRSNPAGVDDGKQARETANSRTPVSPSR